MELQQVYYREELARLEVLRGTTLAATATCPFINSHAAAAAASSNSRNAPAAAALALLRCAAATDAAVVAVLLLLLRLLPRLRRPLARVGHR